MAYFFLSALWVLAGCTIGVLDDDDNDGGQDLTDAGPQQDSGDDGGLIEPDGGEDDAGSDGDGDGDGDGDSPDMAAARQWPAQLAEATCDALVDCVGDELLLVDSLNGRDCVALTENTLRSTPTVYLPDAVAAGTVLFDASELETCLADVRALGCDVRSRRLPASCTLAWLGSASDGDLCALNEECGDGTFCDTGLQPMCPGVCAARLPEGAECIGSDDAQCEDGLVCTRSACNVYGVLGDDCGGTLPSCAPGLLCDDATGQCIALATLYFRADGETCDALSALCEPGLVCESLSSMNTMGECVAPVASGEACKRAVPNQCPIDEYCDAEEPGEEGVCQPRPGDGEPCRTRDPVCADGHVCFEGTCVARKQAGEVCLTDVQCYSGDCGEDGVCVAPLQCLAP